MVAIWFHPRATTFSTDRLQPTFHFLSFLDLNYSFLRCSIYAHFGEVARHERHERHERLERLRVSLRLCTSCTSSGLAVDYERKAMRGMGDLIAIGVSVVITNTGNCGAIASVYAGLKGFWFGVGEGDCRHVSQDQD